ncbi:MULTISPECIES: outer membrane protein [Agrobacterium]|uniref:outer membrane protein n=1 Tax=Agrobacterium tumefaciens TaxID=358 RepID=UPI001573FA39|nr:outer membrane protein [Agrobacterium tumefaciens]MDR5012105.1 porin family protein [Agrobacterium tumefaciens]NTA45445.1 porin family protein [Agrobacterium tumefaciens]WIE36094.1 porin family protein [Agrobacterium tumefaciens]
MKLRLLAFAALALSSAAPVLGADLVYEQPSPPSEQQVSSAYDWSGFYLGAQGGYSWNQATIFGSDVDLDSGSAGGHAGYNFQHGNIVFGIENDFNYNFEKSSDANVEWDASSRGRVGYAWDRTLFFATGGVAAAGVKADASGSDKKDDILIGWTAGAGVEHAFTDNILVRGEYRYSDFGNKDFGSSIGEFGATQHKALLGASYKF